MSTATLAERSPFDLSDDATYRAWREWKLAHAARSVAELVVPVQNLAALQPAERRALHRHIAANNMALVQGPQPQDDPALPRALAAQLGLHRLDANWLAEEDGASRIEVHPARAAGEAHGGFIPYTNRAIAWHTDGYYHPEGRRIHGMVLHCVRPAAAGGLNRLLDHELAYIALRDQHPGHVQALMQPRAMVIPARITAGEPARPAQAGPVFSVCAESGALHMRYTARTRSIEWAPDVATQAARTALEEVLAEARATALQVRLAPGMALVGHNVLHDRSAFEDDPAAPRLLYRLRFLDRVALAEDDEGPPPWRIG